MKKIKITNIWRRGYRRDGSMRNFGSLTCYRYGRARSSQAPGRPDLWWWSPSATLVGIALAWSFHVRNMGWNRHASKERCWRWRDKDKDQRAQLASSLSFVFVLALGSDKVVMWSSIQAYQTPNRSYHPYIACGSNGGEGDLKRLQSV
jgi:hypothetical protein